MLDIPPDLAESFSYRAGQFLTLKLDIDGTTHYRSYSMSSSPDVDSEVRITVKRVVGGVVSNWLNDQLGEGDQVEALPPAGEFVLGQDEHDIVAFAGGSGITPILSIMKTALATTSNRVCLFYANRDRDSVIFATELAALREQYSARLVIEHHLDDQSGFVDAGQIRSFLNRLGDVNDAAFYVCGPSPFMEAAERVLGTTGVDPSRVNRERFDPAEPEIPDDNGDHPGDYAKVTIQMGRKVATTERRRTSSLLQTARALGMKPPSSCESGTCASCMAQLVEGSAEMRHNGALTPDEVADNWVLACQAIPTSATVHVVFE